MQDENAVQRAYLRLAASVVPLYEIGVTIAREDIGPKLAKIAKEIQDRGNPAPYLYGLKTDLSNVARASSSLAPKTEEILIAIEKLEQELQK